MFGHTPQIGTQPLLLNALPCYSLERPYVMQTARYGGYKEKAGTPGMNLRNSVPFNYNYRLAPPAAELPLQDSRDTYQIAPHELHHLKSDFVPLPHSLLPHMVTPLPPPPVGLTPSISTGRGAKY